jgi:redox-sensitive bicupin YhaK (pirin superfamily)
MLRSLAFGAALTLSAVASAAVYKWVDAQGGVHYSDLPPSDKAQVVQIISNPTSRERVAARVESEEKRREGASQDESKQKAEQATQQAVNADVAKSRAKQCDEAKERYRVAIDSHKLYKLGKNGEREYLNDAELSQARLDARRNLDESCGPGAQ